MTKRSVWFSAAILLIGFLGLWLSQRRFSVVEKFGPAVVPLKQPLSGTWNLETNAEGAIFHREDTNLWWLSGPLPVEDIPGLVNVPARAERAARTASNRLVSAALRSGYDALNSQDIVFYGRAVDDKTNALAGATVHATVARRGLSGGSEEKFTATTGADGRFTLSGISGESLTVGLTLKPGYHSATPRLYRFSQLYGTEVHRPDRNNPVVFTLTKISEPEPLIYFKRWYGLPNTGEPVRIDFLTGQKVAEGGDLIVSIECLQPYKEGERFPWRMKVEAVDGGFFRADEPGRLELMYEAPEDGYGPAIEVSYGHEGEGFSPQFRGLYYVFTRDGQHIAKIIFDMTTFWDERGVPFGIQAYVNTNASRNLEIDQSKVINLNRLNGWR